MSSPRLLYYSATIITLDGSDTDAYGEPCEPGQGYTEQFGFWDPDHGYWRVHDSRDAVRPDIYPQRCGQSPARWLAGQLRDRLGQIDSFDHGRSFYAAYEAVHPGTLAEQGPTGALLSHIRTRLARTAAVDGQRIRSAAGHAYGFTDAELAKTVHLLGAQ